MIFMKKCNKCNKEKPLSEFGKLSISPDGLRYKCKECRNELRRNWRINNLEKERTRVRNYYRTPEGLYNRIKNDKGRKKMNMTKQQFVKWYNNQEKRCIYCGLEEKNLKKINDILNNKTIKLSIDCVDNSKGYSLGNIVLACLRCNYTKNDFFTYDQMLKIAEEFIKEKWENELRRKN